MLNPQRIANCQPFASSQSICLDTTSIVQVVPRFLGRPICDLVTVIMTVRSKSLLEINFELFNLGGLLFELLSLLGQLIIGSTLCLVTCVSEDSRA